MSTTTDLLAQSKAKAENDNLAIQTTPRVAQVKAMIESYSERITTELPAYVNATKFMAGITTAVQKNPALLECSNQSLMSAVLMCAGFGLIPNTPLGHAWLIPYKERGEPKAQFQVGYQGLLSLVRASGEITQVQAQVVREGDDFQYEFGLAQVLRHVPKADSEAPITHAYAYVKFNDGTHSFEVMTNKQITGIRKRSKSGSVWATDEEMMARKTVLIRLCRYLPKGDILARAINSDETTVELGAGEVIDVN